MKKLKKEEELAFLTTASVGERKEYVGKFGICLPNQMKLYHLFDEVFTCKNLSQELLSVIMEDEKYLSVVMTKCLSVENQLKFIQLYPDKVAMYLETLEQNLEAGRGAYLSAEAEEVYKNLCEEDPSLPKIKRNFAGSSQNCPFAGLAALLG